MCNLKAIKTIWIIHWYCYYSYSRHVLPSICLFTNKQRFCEKQKILSALLLNFDHENLVLLVVWYHDHTIHMRLNGTICLDELIDEVLEFDGFDNMLMCCFIISDLFFQIPRNCLYRLRCFPHLFDIVCPSLLFVAYVLSHCLDLLMCFCHFCCVFPYPSQSSPSMALCFGPKYYMFEHVSIFIVSLLSENFRRGL